MSRMIRKQGTAGAPRRAASNVRGRMTASEQDAEPLATKFACATHQITYYVVGKTRECPLCQTENLLSSLTQENQYLLSQVNKLSADNETLKQHVDLTSAMASSVDVLNEDDKTWLKETLYEYKLQPGSVVLKVIHDKRGYACGFLAMRRKQEPDGRNLSSVGGLALANYYDEAVTTMGAQKAMKMLTNALWQMLPGAKP